MDETPRVPGPIPLDLTDATHRDLVERLRAKFRKAGFTEDRIDVVMKGDVRLYWLRSTERLALCCYERHANLEVYAKTKMGLADGSELYATIKP